jgi:uncharacterized repeat protein (TIGR01451 family)
MLLSGGSTAGAGQESNATLIHAAKRGSPWISLEDGSQLFAPRNGGIGQARPLTLATADFDEDGVPDLAAGYATANGGLIVLHRGNVDALFPNTPEARRRNQPAPFLPDPRLLETAKAPQFLGAGDFDADGHMDLLLAPRGDDSIAYLAGDGNGRFADARNVALPGPLTTLLIGDVNRPDGLADVIAAIREGEGFRLLVFEGPQGALRAGPESLSLPNEATALAVGDLNGDFHTEIAIAAGKQVVIVQGRDRRLSAGRDSQRSATVPVVTTEAVEFSVRSLAIGRFAGSDQPSVALLSDFGDVHVRAFRDLPGKSVKAATAGVLEERRNVNLRMGSPLAAPAGMPLMTAARISSVPGDDLVILDPANRHVHVLPNKRAGGGDSQALSVQQAPVEPGATLDVDGEVAAVLPMRLNADALSDMAVLHSGAFSPSVVRTAGANYVVTNTADSGAGSLRQAINDANLTSLPSNITFNISGAPPFTIGLLSQLPEIVNPVTLDATTQPGYAGQPIVAISGKLLVLGGNSTIRGLAIHSAPDWALILGRQPGNTIQPENGGNIVEACYLGLRPGGTAASNALMGVMITSPGNRVGGTVPAARNVISANRHEGITIAPASPVAPNGNIVQGNFIGTDVSGTSALGNFTDGVYISGSSGNTIGGVAAGAGNLISGNGGAGVRIDARSNTGQPQSSNMIQGNFLGTDAAGNAAIPNGADGIILRPGDFPSLEIANNLIGGTTPAARNLISGNVLGGVWLGYGNVQSNQIQGNYIGTKIDGVSPLGNGLPTPPPGSIPHNDGIFFEGPGGNGVTSGPSNNVVGGLVAGAGNVIAFNAGNGINVTEAFGTLIAGNAIFSNTRAGIAHFSRSNRTRVSRNSIVNNGGLGIDHIGVGPSEGVTANDACDADAFFVNPLQNFPSLTSAASGGGNTLIKGTLNSTPSTTFTLEFFSSPAGDSSGYGEGQVYLGSASVTAGANCVADFSSGITVPSPVTNGHYVTATAADPDGNTSEFSPWIQSTASTNQPPAAVSDSYNVNEDTMLSVPAPGVLANDSDPDPGTSLAAIQVTPPSHGTLILNANGSFAYTPTANYNGPDSFTYKANDGLADSNVAAVSITVNPVNDTPVASNDSYTVTQNTALNVPAPGVLGNDTDVDGDPLTAVPVSPPSNGALTLNPDGSFTYTPNTGFNGTDTFTYRASDGTAQSNIATVTLTVSATADLSVTLTAPDPVANGEPLTYTITVRNSGPATASTVSLFLDLPASFTFLSGSGAGVESCRPPVFASSLAVCRLSDLPPGGQAVAALAVQPGPKGQYLLKTNVNSVTPDPNAANNQQSWLTTVAPAANLAIQISGTAGSGGAQQYTVTVSNAGPDAATGIVLRGFVGGAGVFDDSLPNSGGCIQGGVLPIICDLNGTSLASGGSVSFVLFGKATQPGIATLELTVRGAELDPVPANNTAQAQVAVALPSADVSIFNGMSMNGVTLDLPLQEGDEVEWLLRVSNQGPQPATGVSVALDFPRAGVLTGGVPAGCLLTSPGKMTCGFPDVAAQSQSLFLRMKLRLTGTGTHTFTATVRANEVDPNPADNSKSLNIPVVVRQADVSVFNGMSRNGVTLDLPLQEGDEVEWLLRVSNQGPRAATGVSVALDFPRSDALTGGVPAGCLLTSPGKMTCSFPDVAAQSQSLFLEMRLRLAGAGTHTFTASVRANEVDPNPADNSKSLNIPVVVRQADVSIFNGMSMGGVTLNLPLKVGNEVEWLLRVSNQGPRAATGVSVALDFPRSDALTGGVPAGCLLTSPGKMTCSFPDVAAQSQSLFLEMRLRLAGAGTHTFTASVRANEVDPNPADNLKSLNIPVISSAPRQADVAITAVNGTFAASTHQVGDSGTLAITVRNLGPNFASSAALTASLSPQVRIDSVSSPCTIAGQAISCPLGPLSPGGTATPVLSVTAVAVGNATLAAAVSAPENTPGGNDSAGLTFAIHSIAALQLGPQTTAQMGGIAVSFANVSAPGNVTVHPIQPINVALPPGFSMFSNLAFDISTTAAVSGPIGVAFNLSGLTAQQPLSPQMLSTLRVLHGERLVANGPLVFVDRTAADGPIITPTGQLLVPVFARVNSLSPFIIARFSGKMTCPADITGKLSVTLAAIHPSGERNRSTQQVRIRNRSQETLKGDFFLVLEGLPSQIELLNAARVSGCAAMAGSVFIELEQDRLKPGQSAEIVLQFLNPANVPIVYTPRVLLEADERKDDGRDPRNGDKDDDGERDSGRDDR